MMRNERVREIMLCRPLSVAIIKSPRTETLRKAAGDDDGEHGGRRVRIVARNELLRLLTLL